MTKKQKRLLDTLAKRSTHMKKSILDVLEVLKPEQVVELL